MNRLFRTLLNGLPATAVATAAFAEFTANPDFSTGDPGKGKAVYQRVGVRVNCHGWPGDGVSGRNPRPPAAGANLHETKLDAQGLYDVIRCGLPGTQMPCHDQASYKDDRCFGMLLSDHDAEGVPFKGKAISEPQLVDLVAYLQKYMVGKAKPTYDEGALYFGTSAETSCSYLKTN